LAFQLRGRDFSRFCSELESRRAVAHDEFSCQIAVPQFLVSRLPKIGHRR